MGCLRENKKLDCLPASCVTVWIYAALLTQMLQRVGAARQVQLPASWPVKAHCYTFQRSVRSGPVSLSHFHYRCVLTLERSSGVFPWCGEQGNCYRSAKGDIPATHLPLTCSSSILLESSYSHSDLYSWCFEQHLFWLINCVRFRVCFYFSPSHHSWFRNPDNTRRSILWKCFQNIIRDFWRDVVRRNT